MRLLVMTLTFMLTVDTSAMTARVAVSTQCQLHRSLIMVWLKLLFTGRSIMKPSPLYSAMVPDTPTCRVSDFVECVKAPL